MSEIDFMILNTSTGHQMMSFVEQSKRLFPGELKSSVDPNIMHIVCVHCWKTPSPKRQLNLKLTNGLARQHYAK